MTISSRNASLSPVCRRTASPPRGFTLVELLVVIGIIALLISILLPSLNRARQQAYLVDCQARMRQMGQAVIMYTVENKGMLPASEFSYTDANNVDWWPEQGRWGRYFIQATLTRLIGPVEPDPDEYHCNKIFEDVPTPDAVPRYPGQMNVTNYNWNAGLFPALGSLKNIWVTPNRPYTTVPITRVKRASEVVAAWDGTCMNAGFGGNAYKNSMGLADKNGGWIWWGTKGMDLQGNPGYDLDTPIGNWPLQEGAIDFRHVDRKTANVLYLDGHVESKKLGELMVKDFCWNHPASAY